MENIIQYILGGTISIIGDYFIWSKLLSKKINFKKTKTYIIFVLLVVLILLNYYFVNNFLKVILLTIIFMPCVYILFNANVNEAIIIPIISQLVFMISEIIFTIIFMLISTFNITNIVSTQFGTLLINIIITLIALFLCKFKVINNLYNYTKKITKKIKPTITLLVLLSLIIIISTIYGFFYFGNNLYFIFLIIGIICIIYGIFIFKIISDKNKFIKVYDKFNTTLHVLREYEDILNEYRISNHENKNQLLMIRNMTKNKKVSKYIDEIINNKLKDNSKLMFEVSVIPEGGLRGLIYSKLLYMKENDIDGKLVVDKNVKTVDFLNMDDSLMLDICKIIGVFIDNAIEEVMDLNKRYIEIDIYMEETYLNIAISNNYSSQIDLISMDSLGYTTKGAGHGYGLSLVKGIIENNKKLKNIKSISNKIFTQILKIKM